MTGGVTEPVKKKVKYNKFNPQRIFTTFNLFFLVLRRRE